MSCAVMFHGCVNTAFAIVVMVPAAFVSGQSLLPLICIHCSNSNLPDGLVLGSLGPQHAAQVTREWAYGGNESTRLYLEAALDVNQYAFPSAAVLDDAGRAVSYILYEPEGNMAMGYTGTLILWTLARMQRMMESSRFYFDKLPGTGIFCLNVRCLDQPHFDPMQRAQFSIKLRSHNKHQLYNEIS